MRTARYELQKRSYYQETKMDRNYADREKYILRDTSLREEFLKLKAEIRNLLRREGITPASSDEESDDNESKSSCTSSSSSSSSASSDSSLEIIDNSNGEADCVDPNDESSDDPGNVNNVNDMDHDDNHDHGQ